MPSLEMMVSVVDRARAGRYTTFVMPIAIDDALLGSVNATCINTMLASLGIDLVDGQMLRVTVEPVSPPDGEEAATEEAKP